MRIIAAPYCYVLFLCAGGSLFDPHLFPNSGPFFEGWYLRITNHDTDDSVGLLFGKVLPSSLENVTGPLVLASILFRACAAGGECKLLSSNANFTTEQLNITTHGQPVTHNPDRKVEANFQWIANNGHEGGSFIQEKDRTSFNFRLGDWSLRGAAGPHVSWNNDGSGPEGWLGNLPLPLHWFVYSLRSPLMFYKLQNVVTGKTFGGQNGAVHLEKNWGKSFPKQWIWSEGISNDQNNVTFAIAGGHVDFLILPVNAYLIGYRNPSAGTTLDFRPDNSIITTEIDGCKGTLNVTARSLSHEVEFRIFGSPKTFSSCLYGPEIRGFQRACVESYDATATIIVSQRRSFSMSYKLQEKYTIANVALEFGGNNVCGNACGHF